MLVDSLSGWSLGAEWATSFSENEGLKDFRQQPTSGRSCLH